MFRTLLQILPLKNGFLFLSVESNKNLQTNNALMFFSRLLCKKKTSITYIKVASCLLYCFRLLVLKHLCATKFQPEDSIQIHVTESKEPLSPRFSPGLPPQPPSRFNFLPLALTDMEIHVCIRKERDSALGAEDSKGGEKQYWQAMLGRWGGSQMGQEACLPTVTRTLTSVVAPGLVAHSYLPQRTKSSRKKYGLETRWQCQGGCPATKLFGGSFRQQT